MGFEPTTLRDLVGCSNHLSYWRLYGEQGPICGTRLEPHHAATQPSNDRHTDLKNHINGFIYHHRCLNTFTSLSLRDFNRFAKQRTLKTKIKN